MNGFRHSVAVKIAYAFCPHRAPLCVESMTFIMKKNPYLKAGEKQGEKRNGTHEDSGNAQKKARKALSAASLVLMESAPRPTAHEIHSERRR